MSLTRYLPIPSDRMGILWTLLSVEDAIILEYGTAGTTTYASKVFSLLNINTENRLFTTGMNEDNIVMGDTKILEEKIIELKEKYSPKIIFVMASSVSSVIGADVKSICKYMEKEIQGKIIVFTQGGFGGDYSSGLKSAYKELISNLSIKKYEIENKYNIIGVSSALHSAKEDVKEIKNIMWDNFKLETNTILSLSTDIDKISKMSKSCINLVLSYEGLEAAKILEKRFGTPYIYGLPIGYQGTKKWLLEIAKILGREIEIKDYKEEIEKNKLEVVIYADYDLAIGLRKFMNELELGVSKVVCPHKINKIENIEEDVIYLKDEKSKIDLFKGLKNTLVLGDNTLSREVDDTNIHFCVYGLLFDIYNVESTLLGFKGADYLKNFIKDKLS